MERSCQAQLLAEAAGIVNPIDSVNAELTAKQVDITIIGADRNKMNMFKRSQFVVTLFILMLLLILSACGSNNGEESSTNAKNKDGIELGNKKIEIPYVAWAGAEASTNVVKALLEDVGYDVTTRQVGKGAMFSSVADGSADAMTATWLPHNAVNLWDKYKDDFVKLTKTIDTAPIGLVVPEYMDINSIEDLKGNEELGKATDWTLTGIEPGSGQMLVTKKALEAYGLDKWKLQASSGPAMVGSLKKAYDTKAPIIVTLWKPHYAFGKWDLKFLDDPKNIYGDPDSIWTVVRKGLKEDSPAAYKVFEQFEWNYDLMNEVMVNIQGGTDPVDAGKQFIKEHPDLLKKWTKGIK